MNKNIEKCLSKYESLIGTKFNSLTILGIESHNKTGHYKLLCKCDCGNQKSIRSDKVINGITKTCGCKGIGCNAYTQKGISRKYSNLYSCWNIMRHRCYDVNNEKYANYGARGITVCEEWRYSFEPFFNWAMANGYQKGLTIDRIDVNGNYEPSNCRWTTYIVQARNKTNNKMITYKGETKCLSQWCEELEIPYHTIRARIRLGWTPEKSFETPIKSKS